MSKLEKIERESTEPEERHTLVVTYPWWGKVLVVLLSLILIPLVQAFMEEGFLFLELLVVAGLVIWAWYVGDCLATREFVLSPAGIEKIGYFSSTVLPAEALVMIVDEQNIRFFHGTEKNLRESVRIRRLMIDGSTADAIEDHARKVFHIRLKKESAVGKGTPFKNGLILAEYEKTVTNYQLMASFMVIIGLFGIFTAAVSENFYGMMPELPSFPVRLACITLAVAAYFFMGRLSRNVHGMESSILVPLETRLKQNENAPFYTALVASGVSFLGLLLFLFFGNMLDFYLFMVLAVVYFFDFYPRLSAWQQLAAKSVTKQTTSEGVTIRRRSLQVSLVLMGALALVSQGETQRYLYASRQDCINDWGDGKDCEEATSSGGSHGSGRFYGPRYGSGGGRPVRAVGVTSVSRGGFGSLGSFHASFGG